MPPHRRTAYNRVRARQTETDGQPGECRLNAPPHTIAIDGPVASGKSSVGRSLSRRWGHAFIDTGVMYRAITWWALRHGIAPDDVEALGALAVRTRMDVSASPDGTRVSLDGVDATPHLRDPEVERGVSLVSAVPAVREAMVAQQRRLAAGRPVVMAGRDIGTVVLPDADLKVYLDASLRRRAERRAAEMGPGSSMIEAVTADLRERDRLDSERAVSPLRPAADAVTIETGDLTLEEVTERIVAIASRRNSKAGDEEGPK